MVVYRYKWVITRKGKLKKKKYRISSDFKLKKVTKKARITKEKELFKKLWKKRLIDIERDKEYKNRYNHELFLRRLEKEEQKKTYGLYCPSCRKIRGTINPVFLIIHAPTAEMLAVRGTCIICHKPTIIKHLRQASNKEISLLS